MESNAVAKIDAQTGLTTFTRDQIDLIKRTVAVGATDDELKLFLYQAQKRKLDPLARQIYFQKRRNAKTGEEKITIMTAIDGYRAIADRTGKYAGNDDPIFDDGQNPTWAKVTVWKIVGGIRCGFTATARWTEYYPGEALGFMWRKMPHLMLGKCAEALALRKAFPDELSGLYVQEEMEQAGAVVNVDASKSASHKVSVPYTSTPTQQQAMKELLVKEGIDEKHWEMADQLMMDRPFTFSELKQVIKEIKVP